MKKSILGKSFLRVPDFFLLHHLVFFFGLAGRKMADFAAWLDGIQAELRDEKEKQRHEVRPAPRFSLCE
jgi:hypothetical protein